jgi:hypothetical protein
MSISSEASEDEKRQFSSDSFKENLEQRLMREKHQLRRELFPWELDQLQRYSELEPRLPEFSLESSQKGSEQGRIQQLGDRGDTEIFDEISSFQQRRVPPSPHLSQGNPPSLDAPPEQELQQQKQKELEPPRDRQGSYVITGKLAHVLPEDYRADLEALRKRWLNDQGLPKWCVWFRTAIILLQMLWGCSWVKFENFLEFLKGKFLGFVTIYALVEPLFFQKRI